MADDISDLRLLTLLTAAGGLTEAARRLDISTSVLSRRLTQMEARLGVRLFTRTTRRFILTNEGSLLHERAVQIVADVDDAEAEASTHGKEPRGMLRVGAPMQLGRRLVAPLIAKFNEHFPRVNVQLVLSDAGLDVVDDELDVVLRVGQPPEPGAIVRKLLSSRRVVCATPDYFARYGVPSTPEELRQHQCLCLVRGRRTFDNWAFQRDGVPFHVRVNGGLTTTSGEVLYDWVVMGKGIGLKGLWDIASDLIDGRLQECLTDFAGDPIDLYAVFASRAHMPPRMRVFIDFIAESFENYASSL